MSNAVALSASVSSVAAATSATTLLAENLRRKGRPSVYYDGAAILYVLAGDGTPSSTNYTLKMGNGYLTYWSPESDEYRGAIKGIWSAAVGSALVTEYV